MRKLIVYVFVLGAAATSIWAAEYDLDEIGEKLADMYWDLDTAYWNNEVYGADSDIEGALAKYDYILKDRELLDFVKESYQRENDPVRKRRTQLIYIMLVESYAESELAPVNDALLGREAGDHLWLSFREEPVSYRDIYTMLYDSDNDPERREILYAASNYEINALNPLHRDRLAQEREIYADLGYESATAFFYDVMDLDRTEVERQAYEIREHTVTIRDDIIFERCEEVLGKKPADTLPWERGLITSYKSYDEYFPGENIMPFTYDFFRNLGLDIESYPNITVDYENRPEKEPRAACFSMAVPEDIRVNLKPTDGIWDYSTAFHEFGHALHYGNTASELPAEFRALGTYELTETYAVLFENLFNDRIFLIEECGLPENKTDEYLEIALLNGVNGMRSLAFSVIYEGLLHDDSTDDAGMLVFYTDFDAENDIFPDSPAMSESSYLLADDEFYSFNYFVAYIAEVQLRYKLKELYGERWYKDPAAGELLKGLFVQGDSITADEMLRQIGYEHGLDASYLLDDFDEMYQVFKETESK